MHNKLESKIVPLLALFLDPNNPRFADVTPNANPVSEDRVHEDAVQKRTMGKITQESFDIASLKESIKTIGFLPVDQLVVVELPEPNKYMVIEGNRRLSALKSLFQEHEEGEETLSPAVLESIANVPVLIIKDDDPKAREHYARVLQGVRHVASVKAWGPYQQAQIVAMMIEDDRSLSEIKETLGLSSMRVNSLRRSYFGLKQMQSDVDHGDKATPRLFSHFEEGYKSSRLRSWMDWDDTGNRYRNDENRKQFYGWCVPYEEDGEKHDAKVNDAKELRQMNQLMENSALFQQFCDSPTLRLPNALRGDAEPQPLPDWKGQIQNCANIVNRIPASALIEAGDEDLQGLKQLRTLCDRLIKLAEQES